MLTEQSSEKRHIQMEERMLESRTNTNGENPAGFRPQGARRLSQVRWLVLQLVCSIAALGVFWSRGLFGVAGWVSLIVLGGVVVLWPLWLSVFLCFGILVFAWNGRNRRQSGSGDFMRGVFDRMRARMLAPFMFADLSRSRQDIPVSGNTAFEEWRTSELSLLRQQYEKIEDVERAFAAHTRQIQLLRDREEFDHFMAAQSLPKGTP